ncbi:hypothetical protein J4733_22630 [Klebsiella pneumoniae]|uniref:Uncharacterized protein n=1 Tax=Klebsiella pneumoniae TaxID=573 RepID=A0A939NQM0_KLEPN|nr:hypothetical protein [Klebsiella pneumoniae]
MSIVILCAGAAGAPAGAGRRTATAANRARAGTHGHDFPPTCRHVAGHLWLTTPEERVLRTRSALRAFTEDDIRQPLRVVPVIRYGQPCRLFLMNGKPVLLLSEADLDEGDDLTLDRSPAGAGAYGSPAHQPPEQFNNRYLFISAGKAWPGRCCWRCLLRRLPRPRRVRRFSCCGSSKNVAPYRSTGGAISAILKFDSMLCWSSFSACWPVISG